MQIVGEKSQGPIPCQRMRCLVERRTLVARKSVTGVVQIDRHPGLRGADRFDGGQWDVAVVTIRATPGDSECVWRIARLGGDRLWRLQSFRGCRGNLRP